MSSQIQIIKEKLSHAITQLCETSWMFVKDPARDFTRERMNKIPNKNKLKISFVIVQNPFILRT